MKYCPHCGTEVDDDSLGVCRECGKRIDVGEEDNQLKTAGQNINEGEQERSTGLGANDNIAGIDSIPDDESILQDFKPDLIAMVGDLIVIGGLVLGLFYILDFWDAYFIVGFFTIFLLFITIRGFSTSYTITDRAIYIQSRIPIKQTKRIPYTEIENVQEATIVRMQQWLTADILPFSSQLGIHVSKGEFLGRITAGIIGSSPIIWLYGINNPDEFKETIRKQIDLLESNEFESIEGADVEGHSEIDSGVSNKIRYSFGQKILLGGTALTIIGGFLPWFSFQVLGTSSSQTGFEHGGGFVTVGLAILVLIFVLRHRTKVWQGRRTTIIISVGAAVGLIAILFIADPWLLTEAPPEDEQQFLEIGNGLYLTLAGGLMITVGPLIDRG